MKTKFYTGLGDRGESFFGKTVLPKSDAIFEVMGELDELNAILGLCRAGAGKKLMEISGVLKKIQFEIYVAQAEVAAGKFGFKISRKIEKGHTLGLEKTISEIDRKIPEIKNFIMPGSCELSARLDYARTVARRAERTLIKYKKANPEIIRYLNRLSSILFALARFANFKLKIKEDVPEYSN